MKFLTHPLLVLPLALLLGIGVGIGTFWRAALPIVQAARLAQTEKEEPQRPEKPWDFWTLEIEGLAAELRDQKKSFAERESALAARESRLNADRDELIKTRRQIEALRDEIAAKMIEIQGDEAKNLKTLATTYSSLTPRAAVGILRQMDELIVVKILSLMKTDVLSPIMEEMGKSPDPNITRQAARYTEQLRLMKTAKPAPAT